MSKSLEVLTLDVWGNEEDGFEVNNMYPSGITLLPDMDEDYYYREVRNYFPHIPPFEIVWDDETSALVRSREAWEPLLEIRAQ